MRKKFIILLASSLVSPFLSWGQTYVFSVEDQGEWKYFNETYSPEVDTQGKMWTEIDYDDSNWATYNGYLEDHVFDNGFLYLRKTFALDEIKENEYYYFKNSSWPNVRNLFAFFINGHFVSSNSEIYMDCHNIIPNSYLKTGENVLAVCIDIIEGCITTHPNALFYDTKYYDFDGRVINMPVVATDISTLDNAIYMNAIETYPEKDIEVQIKLKNANNAASYQFSLDLPWGVDITEVTLVENRHNEHDLSQNGNTFVVISATGGELSGNDGSIIDLKLHVGTRNPCTLPIKINNAVYAKPNGSRIGMPSVTIPITIKEMEKGDANNDQEVTIADVVTIVNRILNNENDSFSQQGADSNNDGFIDVSDAQTTLNKVLHRNTDQASSSAVFDPQ